LAWNLFWRFGELQKSTKLNTAKFSILLPNACKIQGMQKQPSCKKEARPSKVESYLKDECMVWLTTTGDIWMRLKLKYQ